MGADQHFDWRAGVASALAWWDEAGVDALADETPRDWRAVPAPPPRPPRPDAVTAPAAPTPAALPASLARFVPWRIGPDAPEAAWPGEPIAPAGDPAAAIMVLVDMPEREDADSGTLLSGAAGRLFDRMLAAIDRSRGDIYLASLCTVRPAAGRIAPEHEARLGALARHHVALAAPRRLLLLGNAPSRALGGSDVAPWRGGLQTLNLVCGEEGRTVAAVASFHPRLLLERPADKARTWKDLQMLVAGLDA